jgi:uncharacterized Zn-finger protein
MNFVCEFCSEIFSCERFLQDHIATSHRGFVHRCELCGKVLRSEVTLNVHMQNLHNGEKMRTCDGCGLQFPRLASLISHMRAAHRNLLPEKYRKRFESLKCVPCGMEFSRPSSLRRHKETKHGDGAAMHRCRMCDRTFTCQRYLKRHQRALHDGAHGVKTPPNSVVETDEKTG